MIFVISEETSNASIDMPLQCTKVQFFHRNFFIFGKTLCSQCVDTVSNFLSTCCNDINASIRVFGYHLMQIMFFKNSFSVDFAHSLANMNVLMITIDMSSTFKIFKIKLVTYVFKSKRLSLGLTRPVYNVKRSSL